MTQVDLSTLPLSALSTSWNWLAGNSKTMLTSRRKVVAFVAIAFYFLIQEPQTETSRFRKMLMLQQLKRSRRKQMVLLQIALKNIRRARRAWAWPRNQFWFESLLQGDFVEDWWPYEDRSNRSLTSLLSAMIEMLGRKHDNRTIWSPRDVTYYATISGYICHLDLVYQL